jgi:hypothetical protein
MVKTDIFIEILLEMRDIQRELAKHIIKNPGDTASLNAYIKTIELMVFRRSCI